MSQYDTLLYDWLTDVPPKWTRDPFSGAQPSRITAPHDTDNNKRDGFFTFTPSRAQLFHSVPPFFLWTTSLTLLTFYCIAELQAM